MCFSLPKKSENLHVNILFLSKFMEENSTLTFFEMRHQVQTHSIGSFRSFSVVVQDSVPVCQYLSACSLGILVAWPCVPVACQYAASVH